MGRYRAVYRAGKLIAETQDGELTYVDAAAYSQPNRSDLAMPMVVRDIGEYRSPIDGANITSRSHHREHMRQHDVIEVGNEPIGNMQKTAAEPPKTRDIGEQIKRRLEEVQSLPQETYDNHVKAQHAEHAEVLASVVAA